jgi:hypothetical protein
MLKTTLPRLTVFCFLFFVRVLFRMRSPSLLNCFCQQLRVLSIISSRAQVPGLLVGRYLHDVYNGGNPQQPAQGNPWVLCSAALGEFFYRVGIDHMSQGSIAFVNANTEFFTQAMHLAAFRANEMGWDLEPLVQALQTNQVVTASSEAFAAAMRVLLAAGDSILLRIKYAH